LLRRLQVTRLLVRLEKVPMVQALAPARLTDDANNVIAALTGATDRRLKEKDRWISYG
jgi:hypothetical protein